ncbi:MAG: alpha/beta hydrolase, partial [Clostridiales bacterium]|nr:alpha/beta hydrolase [Clostridiales bacterium]
LAVAHKNIVILTRQFRYLMPTGFLFIILSLVINHEKIHFAVIWKNISTFPCNLLFVFSILGFIVMGVLGSRLDAADKKVNWLEQGVNLFAQLCLLLGVLLIWYASDYYRADETVSEQYLQSTDSVVVSVIAQGYYFDGEGTDIACIFYPGAKVEYTAYAPLMMNLAENGIDCFLVEMPYNLAIFGINRADRILEDYEYAHWYLSGHSLGGAMAASYASEHLESLDGLILLASYSTTSLDADEFQVLSIYGSEDQVLSMEKLEEGRQYMPEDYTEVCIIGGNHAWFGFYGEQEGDGKATISREEQWQQTADAVLEQGTS